MATENVPVFNQYKGNGVATEFSVSFPYLEREFVKVYIKRLGGKQEELTDDRFTFVNNTTIKFPVLPTDEILQEGDIIAIQRETPLGSDFEFANQRRLFPEIVMNADDLSFQQIQELSRELGRCYKSSPTDIYTGQELFQNYLDALNDVNAKIEIVIRLQKEEQNLLLQTQELIKQIGSLADKINGEVI